LPVTKVQGIAVRPNTNDSGAQNPIIFLATSYGDNPSKIFKWEPGSFNAHTTSEVASGGSGLENIDFDSDGKLWGITEAGTTYFQTRDKNYGGKDPWSESLGHIFADITLNE